MAGSIGTSLAGTRTFTFDTNPEDLTITATGAAVNDAPWVASDGNPGGFLALTYAQNSQEVAVEFPDIDNGALVKGLRFEADLRIGNSQGDRPADGFSISFARINDPFLTADPTTPDVKMREFAVNGPPEFGTETGLVVSFDTWAGNNELPGGDIEGLIVRVDNVTVLKTELAVRNGACDDQNSLQTGLRDAAFWTEYNALATPEEQVAFVRSPAAWDTLCWQKFVMDLDANGLLTVEWKGRKILDKVATTYFPSASRLVLGGRTGGANEQTHFDNIVLTTIIATVAEVGNPTGNSCDITIPIADAGTSSPVESTIQVQLNGTVVAHTVNKVADTTRVSFSAPTRLAPGSTNTVRITFQDTLGANIDQTRQYVVPAAAVLTSADATTQFDNASSGFSVRVHQLGVPRTLATIRSDMNLIPIAENQLANGILQADGQPFPNIADLSGATAGLFTTATVNWDQLGGDITGNVTGDNFNSTEPADAPMANEAIPGIVADGDPNNIVAEILTFLELKAGCHVLGVSSDDGFIATVGHSPFGRVLGSFNGGRGVSDSGTTFSVVVEQDGVYPIRLAWWEGAGGGNIEFYSVVGTNKYLINDRSNVNAIKAYSAGQAPGVLQSLYPYAGSAGVNPTGPVEIKFKDGLTTLNDASVVLNIDGTAVTPTPVNNGALTTFRYTPATPWAMGSSHTGMVTYTIGSVTSTQLLSFTVRTFTSGPLDPGFAIEAEMFDFDSGQYVTSVDQLPYSGLEYDGFGAVHDVDYHAENTGPFNAEGNPEAHNYRTGILAEQAGPSRYVPMGQSRDAGTLDVVRPGGWSVVDMNYTIGWVGNEWYNYTRTFTNGNYRIIASMAHDGTAADNLRARFGVVVDGHGTTDQTVVPIGSYSNPGSAGWGNHALNLVQQNGQDTIVHLSGTNTIRVFADQGDFDWFAFLPTTDPTPPPAVTSVTPGVGSVALDVSELNIEITDLFRERTINFPSIRLSVDGTDVTTTAQITDTAGGATVIHAPAGGFTTGEHTYTVTFTDSGNTSINFEGNFHVANHPNTFVIEAEDLNYDGGQTKAEASTMPLTPGLYNGLGAAFGVDYNVVGNEAGEATYRANEVPNIPMNNGGDPDRGPFSVSPSYKIGWTSGGDNPEWFNYTRTFPQGNYNVYAALSHGGGGPTAGSLQLVTSAVNTTNQTVQQLGTFNVAGGTGGWGVNRLVPLESGGSVATVALGGTQTVRMTMGSDADFDYLLFVPTDDGGDARITSVTRSGNNLTINWTGGGRLHSAPALNANGSATWTAVAGAGADTATVPISGNMQFFMIRP